MPRIICFFNLNGIRWKPKINYGFHGKEIKFSEDIHTYDQQGMDALKILTLVEDLN
jgi:hypothetical protein